MKKVDKLKRAGTEAAFEVFKKLTEDIHDRIKYILDYIGTKMDGHLQRYDIMEDDVLDLFDHKELVLETDWHVSPSLNKGHLYFEDGRTLSIQDNIFVNFLFEDFEDEVDKAIEYTKKVENELREKGEGRKRREDKIQECHNVLNKILNNLNDENIEEFKIDLLKLSK